MVEMVLDIIKADIDLLKHPGPSNRSDPAAILRTICKDVDIFDRDLFDLAQNMIETMIAAKGVGLAAPQIGVGLNMFVMLMESGWDKRTPDPTDARVIINPKITETSGSYQDKEGCLSIPGLLGRVERHKEILYVKYDIEGKGPQEEHASALLSRIFQHELDHLSGVLFVDRADKLYRPIKQNEDPEPVCETSPK